jgi:hypothetical protein
MCHSIECRVLFDTIMDMAIQLEQGAGKAWLYENKLEILRCIQRLT